jgi:hypothetical protein
MPKQIMIDIETMGTSADAPILSIGAVEFDILTGETKSEYYRHVDFISAFHNRQPDPDTMRWWLTQSDEARQALVDESDTVDIVTALKDLQQWVLSVIELDTVNVNNDKFKRVEMWANDPDFDLTILASAFKQYHIAIPWPFWSGRSCRTVCAMLDGIYRRSNYPREGTHHNALDDTKYQVLYVSEMWCHARAKLFG